MDCIVMLKYQWKCSCQFKDKKQQTKKELNDNLQITIFFCIYRSLILYISVSYFESIKPKIESFVSQKLSIVLLNFLSIGPASQPRCLSSISLLMLKWRLYQQLRREIKKFQLIYYKYKHFNDQSTISQ